MINFSLSTLCLALLLQTGMLFGQMDARMLRQPNVSQAQIAFVYVGGITVPTLRMYSTDGKWFAEGHGVEPDIEVWDDPGAMAAGKDPQLDRAIQDLDRLVKEKPAVAPKRPAYEDRSNHAAPLK